MQKQQSRAAKVVRRSEAAGAARSPAYSRLWHADSDDRQHQGKRKWDPAALGAIIELASCNALLYPPDWSGRSGVRLRFGGRTRPFCEIQTNDPRDLGLILVVSPTYKVAELSKRLGLSIKETPVGNRRQWRMSITTLAQVRSAAFESFFKQCLSEFVASPPRSRRLRLPQE